MKWISFCKNNIFIWIILPCIKKNLAIAKPKRKQKKGRTPRKESALFDAHQFSTMFVYLYGDDIIAKSNNNEKRKVKPVNIKP
jgi:hypothetical protein